MHRHLARWQGKNQPAMSRVDRSESKHVAHERAVGVGIAAEKKNVRPSDHRWLLHHSEGLRPSDATVLESFETALSVCRTDPGSRTTDPGKPETDRRLRQPATMAARRTREQGTAGSLQRRRHRHPHNDYGAGAPAAGGNR